MSVNVEPGRNKDCCNYRITINGFALYVNREYPVGQDKRNKFAREGHNCNLGVLRNYNL